MKKTFLMLLFVVTVLAVENAQAQTKTIVLVRHAEKVDAPGNNDPELTASGKERAVRLIKKVGRVKEVFSTDLKRTRDTAAPLAAKRKLQIQTYDPRKPQELVDRVMKSRHKRVLIVGHSNTIPPLANLIGKMELFRNLDDPEHRAIWIMRIKKGQLQKIEILNY
jgi:broad specificity phosphatase PhoE